MLKTNQNEKNFKSLKKMLKVSKYLTFKGEGSF
jgi:hypothetical protein